MRSKILMAASLVATVGLLLAGCSAGASPSSTPTAEKTTLTTTIGVDVNTFNPALSSAPQNRQVGCLIYQGLVRVDSDYNIQPQLASSWKVSSDGLTYTFTLQQGVKWTDGQAFTADDVVYSLLNIDKLSPGFAAAAKNIKNVIAVDANTVEVDLSAPFGPFLMSLSCDLGGAVMVPKHIYDDGTDPAKNAASVSKPVGTGPFMLDSVVSGDNVTLVANPNYWRPGEPYLQKIVFRIIPDANARILALLSGEIDYIYHYWVDRNALGPVESDSKFKTVDSGTPGDFDMIVNNKDSAVPALADASVRKALFQAIDFNYIKQGPMAGYGDFVHSFISRGISWASDPNVDLTEMYPYDPSAAKAALAKAGYPNGFTIRIAYDASNPVLKPMAEAVANYWKAIGLSVVDSGSDINTMLSNVYAKRDFDVALVGLTTSGDPALGISRLYVTNTGNSNYVNPTGYSNSQVDQLFAQGASLTSNADRAAPYYKVQELLAQDMPSWPMVEVPNIHASVVGFEGAWKGLMAYGEWWDEARLYE